MAESQSPAARRLRPPSWLDLRLVVGVLLVLVAVLVGARVVAGADKSTRIWGIARDVASGTTLKAGDLRAVRVRLYDDAGRYLSAATSPVGHVVNRDLRTGDLLPSSALGAASSGVLVGLPVDPANLPAGLGRGDRIAIYASDPKASKAIPPVPVLSELVVQSISGGQTGALSGGSNSKLQVLVEVHTAVDAKDLVGATANATIIVVKEVGHTAVDARSSDAPRPAAPAPPPGGWAGAAPPTAGHTP